MKKDCSGQCKFRCSLNIDKDERGKIFHKFWGLTGGEKAQYYAKTTIRCEKERKRTKQAKSRRKYSLKYFFFVENQKIRVCKEYYLATLDISQRRISYFHEHVKDKTTGIPHSGAIRGKHTKKVIPEDQKDFVREHIQSFPRIESHYCRKNTNKEYLESSLTLQKMYDMYCVKCEEQNKSPVKQSMYRNIFNKEFNIDFHQPKKDRCDICEENKVREMDGTNRRNDDEEFKQRIQKHIAGKISTKEERDNDRTSGKPVVVIDLQNVIALPRANISSFFYKRKLNAYNLTAHFSVSKEGYCCVWTEAISGRAGNDLASATVQILEKVTSKHPDITELTLWTDSCVPQNRNSALSLALLEFMEKHAEITKNEQKYCEPGHSVIQEVDNLHSQIEKVLSVAEVYSPLSLLRLLLQSNKRKPLNVI